MISETTRATRSESYQLTLPTSGTRREQVLAVLATHAYGLTAEEIADKLGKHPYTVRPRITELAKAGNICARGTRLSTTTGRNIAIWFVI